MVEKLRRRFGFAYEAIVRVMCNATTSDEFDIISSLFEQHYLRNTRKRTSQPSAEKSDNSTRDRSDAEGLRVKCLDEGASLCFVSA